MSIKELVITFAILSAIAAWCYFGEYKDLVRDPLYTDDFDNVRLWSDWYEDNPTYNKM